MKSFSIHFGFVLLLSAVCGSVAPASADAICAPAKMVHVRWTDVTPGTPRDSFASKPKDVYRVSSDKSRVEEALDAENRLHELIVAAEPDIWLINLYDQTGKHITDPGPTFFARLPVLAIGSLPQPLLRLEFGCEADFIAANSLKPVRNEQIEGQSFDVYRMSDGLHTIELLERAGTGTPGYARYYNSGDLKLAIRYDLYESGLEVDPSLFKPPSGVKLTDAKT